MAKLIILIQVLLLISYANGYKLNSRIDQLSLKPDTSEGRIFFGIIGDFINNSEWFPIEINVPDLLGGIGSTISGIWSFITGGGSGSTNNKPSSSVYKPIQPVLQQTNVDDIEDYDETDIIVQHGSHHYVLNSDAAQASNKPPIKTIIGHKNTPISNDTVLGGTSNVLHNTNNKIATIQRDGSVTVKNKQKHKKKKKKTKTKYFY